MGFVRKLRPEDVDQVVARIIDRLNADHEYCTLVNPVLSPEILAGALRAATNSTWVNVDGDRIVGHLYGALLSNDAYGDGVWIGPDGASFDTVDDLADLYSVAAQEWIDRNALEHYVWVLDQPSITTAWYELGFSRMHMRGVLALQESRSAHLREPYRIRRGSLEDFDLSASLLAELDRAQMRGPSFSLQVGTAPDDDLDETLSDPEVHLYVADYSGVGVGQCITYPLPPRRGSFDATLHLSAVVVLADHRHRGVATALVNTALNDALHAGFDFVETNWRVTNRVAARYWQNYGFQPTYVRLHRTIGTA